MAPLTSGSSAPLATCKPTSPAMRPHPDHYRRHGLPGPGLTRLESVLLGLGVTGLLGGLLLLSALTWGTHHCQ